MTASSTGSRRKALVGIFLLIVVGLACLGAARWQLDRGHQREALQAAREAGSKAPPLALDTRHPSGPEWHTAQIHGVWRNDLTVLLDNRNLHGRPGLWVATPLVLADDPKSAVLVLRGWLARPLPPATLPTLDAAAGPQTIHGTIRPRIPRLFDLGSLTGAPNDQLPAGFPVPGAPLPRLQNLALDTLAHASRLTFLPIVLQQAPTQDAGLEQVWPGPSVDAARNFNYALQWFSFAAIALGAAALMIWRLRR